MERLNGPKVSLQPVRDESWEIKSPLLLCMAEGLQEDGNLLLSTLLLGFLLSLSHSPGFQQTLRLEFGCKQSVCWAIPENPVKEWGSKEGKRENPPKRRCYGTSCNQRLVGDF